MMRFRLGKFSAVGAVLTANSLGVGLVMLLNAAVVLFAGLLVAGVLRFGHGVGHVRAAGVVVTVGMVVLGVAALVPTGVVAGSAVAGVLLVNSPQVWLSVVNLARSRPTGGVSLAALGLGATGSLLWVGYGVGAGDRVVVVGNVIMICIQVFVASATLAARRRVRMAAAAPI